MILTIFRLPSSIIGWYTDRIARIHKRQAVGWMVAEIVCMTSSLVTVGLIITDAILEAAYPESDFFEGWWLPLLTAGAVGYLTNLIAIVMLFRPYNNADRHPIRLIPFWTQGLMPRNKDELAVQAGKQVAERLLTSEAIADEIRNLIEGAFQDEKLQEKLRYNLGPIIRSKLPVIVEEATPHVMLILRELFAEGLNRDNVLKFLDTVITPWLNERDNKQRFTEGTVAILKEQAPFIRQKLMAYSQQYKSRSSLRKFALNAAEWMNIINWDEIEQSIAEMIDSADTRRQLAASIEKTVGQIRQSVDNAQARDTIEQLQYRLSDFVAEWVDQYLKGRLPELGNRIADDKRFWRWLATEIVPSLKPYLLSWLETEGTDLIRSSFNVAGRVQSAIESMNIKDMHDMVNEVSARHLGAIQVLGFALGLAVGALMLLG